MPIINREGSDSAILDNVLEFLVMNGRPLTRAASMLLPEPWDHNDNLSEERRAYDEHLSDIMIQNDALDGAKLEGRMEERYGIAANMKKLGLDIRLISQATGLTSEEIAKL